jgi:hypothetical protein
MALSEGNEKTVTLRAVREYCLRRDTNVVALARNIKKSPQAVYGAIRFPTQFPDTYKLLMEVLNERRSRNKPRR